MADESEFILASSDSYSDNDFYSSIKKSHKKQIPQIILQKIAKYMEMQKHEGNDSPQHERKKRPISIRNERNRNVFTFNINIAGTDISHAKVAKSRSPSQKKMLDKSLNATPQKRREIRHFLEDQKAEKSFKAEESKKKSIEQAVKRI